MRRKERTSWFAIPVLIVLCTAGCLSSVATPTYSVNTVGSLVLSVPDTTVRETLLYRDETLSVSGISFFHIDRDVYALLVTPRTPRAAIVLVPGAGVKKEGHRVRAEEYARAGIAVIILDVRGNGGETAGSLLDIEGDYRLFREGSWPQYYAIVADILAARRFLDARYGVPVFAIGESNGGRYAAVASAADDGFAGYIGVSTSGFGLVGDRYTGEAKQFLLSIDPDHAVGGISPRPAILLHAPDDTIIPYQDGYNLFVQARQPKVFWNLSSGHGLNQEADERIIGYILNFNGS